MKKIHLVILALMLLLPISIVKADKFINELYVDKEQQLLEENQQLKNELNRILNSKDWKLLEKIRKIKG